MNTKIYLKYDDVRVFLCIFISEIRDIYFD